MATCVPPRLKVLIITLDGSKHGLVVDRACPDKDHVKLGDVKKALGRNPDLAALAYSATFEIYDTDFDDFLAVSSTTDISDKAKLRVRSVDKSVVNPQLPTPMPTVIEPKTLVEIPKSNGLLASAKPVFNTSPPPVSHSDWRLNFFDILKRNTRFFEDPNVETGDAWTLVAKELNMTILKDYWTGDRCKNSLMTLTGFYFNALKRYDDEEHAQKGWAYFKIFHNELKLEVLCEDIHKCKLKEYQDDFIAKQKLVSKPVVVRKLMTSEHFGHLVEVVEMHESKFEDPGFANWKVWELVEKEMSRRGFYYSNPGDSFKNKFTGGLMGSYLNCLLGNEGHWSFFHKFHNELNLKSICDANQWNKVIEYREIYKKKKLPSKTKKEEPRHQGYTNGSNGSHSVPSSSSVDDGIREKSVLLNAIEKCSLKFADPKISNTKVWEDVAYEMSKNGINWPSSTCFSKFACGMISEYYTRMKASPDTKKAQQAWKFFDTLHSRLDLKAICTSNQWENIRAAREQFETKQLESVPRRVSLANSVDSASSNHNSGSAESNVVPVIDCLDEKTALIEAIKKFKHHFADYKIPASVIWEDISAEMFKRRINCPAKKCLNLFVCGLMSEYLKCLVTCRDSISAQASWPHFIAMHKEIDLEVICVATQWTKVCDARQQFARRQSQVPSNPNVKVREDPNVQHLQLLESIVKFQYAISADDDVTFWSLVACDMRSKEHGSGSLSSVIDDCKQQFANLTNMYISRLKENTGANSHLLEQWKYFEFFHEKIKLPLLLHSEQNIEVSRLRSAHGKVSNSVSNGVVPIEEPAQTPSSINDRHVNPEIPIVKKLKLLFNRNLVEKVISLQCCFENSTMSQEAVWNLIRLQISGHGRDSALLKQRFHELVKKYAKTLEQFTSLEDAKNSWPLFEKFYLREVNLEMICDPVTIKETNDLCRRLAKSPLINRNHLPEENITMDINVDILRSVLNCHSIKTVDDAFWTSVTVNLKLTKIQVNFDCRSRFDLLFSNYLFILKTDVDNGSKNLAEWPYFELFHKSLKLDRFLPNLDFIRVRGWQLRWNHLRTVRKSSMTDHFSLWKDLIELLEEHQDFIIENHFETGWQLIADAVCEIGHEAKETFGSKECFEVFDDIYDKYKNVLRVHNSPMEAQIEWPFFNQFHRLKLNLISGNISHLLANKREKWLTTVLEPEPPLQIQNTSSFNGDWKLELLRCVLLHEMVFENGLRRTAWTLVAFAMQSRNVEMVNCSSGPFCRDIFEGLVENFIDQMTNSESLDFASNNFEFFDMLYNELNLKVICERELFDRVREAGLLWNVDPGHENGFYYTLLNDVL